MMTGIPIENNLWTAYLLTIFLWWPALLSTMCFTDGCLTGHSSFYPLSCPGAGPAGVFPVKSRAPPLFLWPVATHAFVGALLGFCIPLAAALATNSTGLGGGDIKFCGILGLVYGPSGMALVFLTAAVTAMPVIFLLRRLYRTGQPLCYPVPAISPVAAVQRPWPNYFKIGRQRL